MIHWIERQEHKLNKFMIKHEPKVTIVVFLMVCALIGYVLSKVS